MKKLIITLFILFVLALTFANSVYACSISYKEVSIACDIEDSILQRDRTCISNDCSSAFILRSYSNSADLTIIDRNADIDAYEGTIKASINERHGINFYDAYFHEKTPGALQKLLTAIDELCVENIDDIKPLFVQEAENWSKARREFKVTGLTFQPYSEKEAQRMIEDQTAYENCFYEDFKKVGDWLIVTQRPREYCEDSGFIYCSGLTISRIKFSGFLLSNLNNKTLPYLVPYLVIIAVFIGLILYLLKREELFLFFKPNKVNIIFTLAFGLMTFVFFIGSDIVIWILILYLIGSSIRYVYGRGEKGR